MVWIDVVILVAVALSALAGLKQGAVRMAFALAGLFFGVFLAGKFGAALAQALFSGSLSWGPLLAYVIIFILVAVAAGIAGAIVSKVVQSSILGWIDRLVGAVAGILSGLLTVAAILAALSVFMPDTAVSIRESGIASFLLSWAPFLLALLPRDLISGNASSSGIGASVIN
jgi:membrane protein required for colicin V production